jgi:hypothetical protein
MIQLSEETLLDPSNNSKISLKNQKLKTPNEKPNPKIIQIVIRKNQINKKIKISTNKTKPK